MPSDAATRVPLTLQAWAALAEDEPGEFVAGYLTEEEEPSLEHETVVVWLIAALKTWLAGRGGFVFGSEVKFAVTPSRGRKPDVSLFLPGGPPLPRQGMVSTPPEVMVEVLSDAPADARRDRIEKPDEYASFGVHYYWLVDPIARTLEIFELNQDGRYVRILAAATGTVNVPGCDGLVLDLDELWGEVARLQG